MFNHVISTKTNKKKVIFYLEEIKHSHTVNSLLTLNHISCTCDVGDAPISFDHYTVVLTGGKKTGCPVTVYEAKCVLFHKQITNKC